MVERTPKRRGPFMVNTNTLSVLKRRRAIIPGVAVLLLIASAFPVAAQDTKSPAVARELARLLDAAKLDGIAAADPATPGAFVAALYIPGSQLLVVGAKYAAPPLLLDRISKKEYRD